MKYKCTVCGYIYDDAENPVPFDELPEDWKCPVCSAPREMFKPVAEKKDPPAIYICTVCGYVYDDLKNDIPFAELPADWKCPVCGADKSMFKRTDTASAVSDGIAASTAERRAVSISDREDLKRLSPGELSALFSNLARGCEKQYQQEAGECFSQIASYFEDQSSSENTADIERLASLVKEDLDRNYIELIKAAEEVGDRGTLRITTWGEKVTRMASGLIERYLAEGGDFLKDTYIYVCTVCGFIYAGDDPPELCPVCKVPGWKFEKIEGGER